MRRWWQAQARPTRMLIIALTVALTAVVASRAVLAGRARGPAVPSAAQPNETDPVYANDDHAGSLRPDGEPSPLGPPSLIVGLGADTHVGWIVPRAVDRIRPYPGYDVRLPVGDVPGHVAAWVSQMGAIRAAPQRIRLAMSGVDVFSSAPVAITAVEVTVHSCRRPVTGVHVYLPRPTFPPVSPDPAGPQAAPSIPEHAISVDLDAPRARVAPALRGKPSIWPLRVPINSLGGVAFEVRTTRDCTWSGRLSWAYEGHGGTIVLRDGDRWDGRPNPRGRPYRTTGTGASTAVLHILFEGGYHRREQAAALRIPDAPAPDTCAEPNAGVGSRPPPTGSPCRLGPHGR